MRKIPKLKEGEVICRWCEGSGFIYGVGHSYKTCDKCFGIGKLDWIDNAKGGKTPKMFQFGIDSSAAMSTVFGTSIHKLISDEMGKEISDAIDKEILESLRNTILKGG